MRDNYAFYILDNVSADLCKDFLRQRAEDFCCFCSGIRDRDRFGAAHCRSEFFFEDLYIISVSDIVLIHK